MLNDNLLENRLNLVKEGKEIQQPNIKNNISIEKNNSLNSKLNNSIINVCIMLIYAFIYGYSMKTLFSTDWNILACLTIGIITFKFFNFFNKILKLFK